MHHGLESISTASRVLNVIRIHDFRRQERWKVFQPERGLFRFRMAVMIRLNGTLIVLAN